MWYFDDYVHLFMVAIYKTRNPKKTLKIIKTHKKILRHHNFFFYFIL